MSPANAVSRRVHRRGARAFAALAAVALLGTTACAHSSTIADSRGDGDEEVFVVNKVGRDGSRPRSTTSETAASSDTAASTTADATPGSDSGSGSEDGSGGTAPTGAALVAGATASRNNPSGATPTTPTTPQGTTATTAPARGNTTVPPQPTPSTTRPRATTTVRPTTVPPPTVPDDRMYSAAELGVMLNLTPTAVSQGDVQRLTVTANAGTTWNAWIASVCTAPFTSIEDVTLDLFAWLQHASCTPERLPDSGAASLVRVVDGAPGRYFGCVILASFRTPEVIPSCGLYDVM